MTETWHYSEEPAAAGTFPWPPREGSPVLASFGETWKSSTFDPGAFFGRVPRSTGTGPALLYYLLIGIMVAGASLFWNTLTRTAGLGEDTLASELGVAAVEPVVGFLLSPVILLVGLFIMAGVVHVLLLVMGGAAHGFGTTVRVFCYAYSPMIFGVIPLLGTVVGGIWMAVIAIIGLREGHGTVTWKAAVAVLFPFILMLGLMTLAFVMLVAASAALLA